MLTLKQRASRSAGRRTDAYRSAGVMAQRRALRMAARDTRLLGIPRMSQSYGGMRGGDELKGMDTLIDYPTIASTTGTNDQITTLNLIQAGTGSWNRIGRKSTLKSVRLTGWVTVNHYRTAGDWQPNIVRLILVWDKQPAGAAEPLFSDIFGQTSQAGTETSTWWNQPKYDTMSRFTVLKDWTYESTAEAGVAADADVFRRNFHVDCFVRLPNLETTFSGQSSPMTIADINNGALYFIARTRINIGTSTDANLTLQSRVRYLD